MGMGPVVTDWELLREYALRRSERAFGEVVTRHIDMVHSAAVRQVRDPHLAEDVAQAVFIILARKAGSLPQETVISAWLLTTTRYAAANAMRMRMRRDRHERNAGEQMKVGWDTLVRRHAASAKGGGEWDDVAPQLDGAVAQLGKTDRQALVLRYFEQKSLRDVGQAMGLSEDAAKKRVSRAVYKLRDIMSKQSKVTMPALALGVLLSSNAVQAAPTDFASKVTAAAMAAEGGGFVPPIPMEIAKSTGMLMAWNGMRWMVAAIILTLIGVGPVVMNQILSKPIEREQPKQVVPQEGPTAAAPAQQQARL
jgi:RNA polymerase sigma factor (sigma-70 family)